jgi:hypothetical protein
VQASPEVAVALACAERLYASDDRWCGGSHK